MRCDRLARGALVVEDRRGEDMEDGNDEESSSMRLIDDQTFETHNTFRMEEHEQVLPPRPCACLQRVSRRPWCISWCA